MVYRSKYQMKRATLAILKAIFVSSTALEAPESNKIKIESPKVTSSHFIVSKRYRKKANISKVSKKVKVGNYQEMAQSERNSHSTNREVGKKN